MSLCHLHLVVMHQFVHPSRSQCCPDSVDDCHAGVDIADQLSRALARVCSLPQEDDLGLLQGQMHQITHYWVLPGLLQTSYETGIWTDCQIC